MSYRITMIEPQENLIQKAVLQIMSFLPTEVNIIQILGMPFQSTNIRFSYSTAITACYRANKKDIC